MNALVETTQDTDIELTELTIAEVQQAFDAGRYTSEALTRAYLARIERYEPYYNAFTFMNPTALEDAKAADARRSAGEKRGAFDGIPVVIKEAMDFAGLPSTGGWAPLSSAVGGFDLIPERDAPVVARLKAAGAVILGKTNIPAFSHDGTRANTSWDGPTFNAVKRAIAPGASSSGTATAVSGNFAVVGLAEETGGSIQNPAAAQSLVSVKPTFALVPNSGVTPLAGSTRDVVGPHARAVVDAALLLDVIAGYTVEDAKTVAAIGNVPEAGYASKLSLTALNGARVGLYGEGWRTEPLSPEAQALYMKAIEDIKSRGAITVEDPFRGSDFATLAVKTERFDTRGMESLAYDFDNYLRRLGPSAAANSLTDLQKMLTIDPFAEDNLLGKHAKLMPVLKKSLENPTIPPDFSEFLAARQRYLKTFNAVMKEHDLDVLIFPQSSAELPGIFEKKEYPSTTVSEINIAGLPGVTVPAGQYENGAPFSLILIGRMWAEAELLAYAYDYEQATKHRIVPQLEQSFYEKP
jgi:Asp-tRNA(Asn)/Glu-tRNA(Gln) amidotransferase A subunit family amidase